MRLTVPPLEIEEDEGFSEEKDIFRRKEFGERLADLIEDTDGELVIALDAPWGEGKSTFVKMWRGHLKTIGIQSVYFDAFENDHQSAPFLALAAEIYNLIGENNEDEKSKFKDVAVSALKTTGRIGLRVGIKALTAGILDETVFMNYGTDKDISKETAAAVDGYVSNRLKSASKDKENIKEFKGYLENLPTQLGTNGKPIVFVIDELDRCKPPFALEIVEVVKHLFSVPNITFVLVMNRTQLEASVTKEYGTPDPSKYLQKFINLWVSLPKRKDIHNNDAKNYFLKCLKSMGIEPKNPYEGEWIEDFEELIVYYNASFREIERSLTNFAFIQNRLNIKLNEPYRLISAYLCIIKVIFAPVYNQLAAGYIDYPTLVTKTNLAGFQQSWRGKKVESHYLKWLLRYYLSNDEQATGLLSEGRYLGAIISANGRTAIQDICRWLDSFRTN